jgi:predicted nucleotide-binding protein (sugar kinase/HSP70/actin superfamily)
MDKVKIGLPRTFFYYNEGRFLKYFLEELDFDVIVSPPTTNEIKDLGIKYSNDEMCTSIKLFLGHVAYLEDKCEYILNIRMDNTGIKEQGCTNYISTYDLINNIFDKKIINITIDHYNYRTLYKELLKIFNKFNVDKRKIKTAYLFSKIRVSKENKKEIIINTNKLYDDNKKILVVGHSYNLYDELIGDPIIKMFDETKISIIYCDKFDTEKTKELSKNLSKELYWKYSKESAGAVELSKDNIDGIIFISSFPCAPDSMVNELIIRKTKLPYLNIIVDDLNSLAGIETRIESFIDIIEQK